MAAAQNTLMKAKVEQFGGTGSIDIFFRSNKNLYTGNFGAATGIAPATGADRANPPTDIKNLVRAGYLFRCFVVIAGDSNDPPIQRKVYVANNKLSEFKTWASAGSNQLPGGPARNVISGGLKMVRMTLK
jgi:hypothetical protein